MRKPRQGRGGKRSTIGDVAKLAGVSTGTVSRALNGVRNVDPDLSSRVREAADQLRYRPDIAARSMRSRRTRVIGVLMPDFQNPLTSAAVAGIEEELSALGYTMFLANSRYDLKREERILHEFEQRRVDGTIAMIAHDENAAALAVLRQLRIPLVLIEREPDIRTDSVRTDQIDGTYRATRYLLGLGHRRIGLVTVPATNLSGRYRLAGFKKAFTETRSKLPRELICMGDTTQRYALDAAYAILTAKNPPSALVVSGGLLGGVLEAVRQLNLKIPDQLSIVSLGDTELAALATPPITAVRYDWAETGRVAARMIVSRADGASDPVRRVVVPYEFIIRRSCTEHGSAG